MNNELVATRGPDINRDYYGGLVLRMLLDALLFSPMERNLGRQIYRRTPRKTCHQVATCRRRILVILARSQYHVSCGCQLGSRLELKEEGSEPDRGAN
jgi:hypothetical protein